MSADILDFPNRLPGPLAERRAQIARRGVQIDFATLLGKLERTLGWLDRHQIEVAAFAASTIRGAVVQARACGPLAYLLREEKASRGHCCVGGSRFEKWEARDPQTGVLICWEEEVSA